MYRVFCAGGLEEPRPPPPPPPPPLPPTKNSLIAPEAPPKLPPTSSQIFILSAKVSMEYLEGF